MTTPFILQSSIAEKPFPVSSVKFHAGLLDSSPPVAARKGKPPTVPSPTPQADSLTIDTFSIQLGPSTTLEVQGNLDYTGYRFSTRGMVPLERLLVLGKTTGFETGMTNFSASAVANLDVNGFWGNSPRVRGTAHLQNLAAWIPGIKDRLLLAQADAQLTDEALVLAHVNGQFEHTPVAFTGTITSPWTCADPAPCPLEFDLHSDTLAIADVAGLFSANDKGWSLPFLSDSSSSNKLPELRGKGNLSVDQLKAAQLTLEKFSGHLEIGNQTLQISRIAAKLGGGAVTGEWHADWSGPQPRYTASGALTGVALDHLGPQDPQTEKLSSWITGKTDAKYSFHFEGRTSQEMISSAAGRGDVTVNTGTSRVLLLEASKPLKFQSFQGAFELDKQTLKILPGKFRADNRIYEVSGTLSLADQQAKLKITNGGSRWEITGALEQPRVAAQPMAAQTTSTHPR
jgi:hypothetical protein